MTKMLENQIADEDKDVEEIPKLLGRVALQDKKKLSAA